MLVRDGRVHVLEPHLRRLAQSVAALYAMTLPRDLPRRVRDAAVPLLGEHRLRVDVLPGGEPTVSARPVAPGHRRPVTLEPFVVPGGLGPHKWRDRSVLDTAPRHRGATSGEVAPLLLDNDGTVLEAAWGNVWLLEADRLVTPPADGRILPGVTRALLLARAGSLGLRAVEEPVTLHRVRAARVVFATSAIRLAVPATLAGGPARTAGIVNRIRAALS